MDLATKKNNDRREFLTSLSSGALAVGLASIAVNPTLANVIPAQDATSLEAWFTVLKGKHRMMFDVVTIGDGYSIIWPFTFMKSNNVTGTPDEDLSVVVIFRSKAIALALDDKVWNKYKFGKLFKVTDYSTNLSADKNIYWDPKEGELPEKGMSIKNLMARGVKFFVCDTALTMTSRQLVKNKNDDYTEIKKDLVSAIIPGIQVVPSGVWAVNRAQENGCSYCYAG